MSDAPTVPLDTWRQRIQAARRRREQHTDRWAFHARLFARASRRARAANDDELVDLPSGDRVTVGAIHRNVEQTLALLHVPEVNVHAVAQDYRRELDRQDTHREAVVSTALTDSLSRSGLLARDEVAEDVKRDGVIIGHGISYSEWRVVKRARQVGVPVYTRLPDGELAPLVGPDGLPVVETEQVDEVVHEGVQDHYVSPLEFLFEASARHMARASWHGRETVARLEEVRAHPRYGAAVPPDLSGTAFRERDLYGDEPPADEVTEADSVRVVVIWDRAHAELITLLETSAPAGIARGRAVRSADAGAVGDLHVLEVAPWPVTFDHPDDSPFRFFIPLPANDWPWGISQIEHVTNQADELDKLRTRQANITRQIKRIPYFVKGRVDGEQLAAAFNGPDVQPVGLDLQDGEKAGDVFGELATPTVHPELYAQSAAAERDIDKTTGISDVPGSGADTATEAEYVFKIGGARVTRKRARFMAYLAQVAEVHRVLLREFAPDGQRLVVYGADGQPQNQVYGREAFAGQFSIDVNPGGEAAAVSPVEQKALIETANLFLGRFGPQFDKVFARQVLTKLRFRDINTLLQAIPADQMAALAAQAAGAPAPGAGPGRANLMTPEFETSAQQLQAAFNQPAVR